MSNLNEVLSGQAKDAVDTSSLMRQQERIDIETISSILTKNIIHSINTGAVRTSVNGDVCRTIVKVSKRVRSDSPFIAASIQTAIYSALKSQLSDEHTIRILVYSDRNIGCVEVSDDCVGGFACLCCLPLLCIPCVCGYEAYKSRYPLWTAELIIERNIPK
jgi:hypothetical protein